MNGGSNSDRIYQRRQAVARLRLHGATMREVVALLPGIGIVNPRTQAAYALGTIANDIRRLREEWRESAAADTIEHKARQLAELREARRAVWRDGDISEVRRNIETEMKLLGTAAPAKVEQDHAGEIILRVIYDDSGVDNNASETPSETE